MDRLETQPANIDIGVVGLGLMGSSIIVSLLLAGHRVKGIAPITADLKHATSRIRQQLHHCRYSNLLKAPIEHYEAQLEISQDYAVLQDCKLVFECVIEDIDIKETVYAKIAAEIAADTVIATNTSAIAISTLQKLVLHPERFIGIHWAEPAYATRFMEITCGEKTRPEYADWIFRIAKHWGKEPTILRKDIRGFITNRLMYAVYRETFWLIDQGKISIEDADKAFRYDVGSWITIMGIFRRMDLMGLPDFMHIFDNIFPSLSNDDGVPPIMQKMVEDKARGTQNLNGLYPYTKEDAEEWEKAFARFNKEIYQLASQYL